MTNFLQEVGSEPDDHTRRVFQLVELQQEREHLIEKSENHQMKVKNTFDRKTKKEVFKIGDFVLKWDVARQKKGQHGKFDSL